MDEEIYMEQPEGYVLHGNKQKRQTHNLGGIFQSFQNTNSKSLSSSKGGYCEEYIIYRVKFR